MTERPKLFGSFTELFLKPKNYRFYLQDKDSKRYVGLYDDLVSNMNRAHHFTLEDMTNGFYKKIVPTGISLDRLRVIAVAKDNNSIVWAEDVLKSEPYKPITAAKWLARGLNNQHEYALFSSRYQGFLARYGLGLCDWNWNTDFSKAERFTLEQLVNGEPQKIYNENTVGDIYYVGVNKKAPDWAKILPIGTKLYHVVIPRLATKEGWIDSLTTTDLPYYISGVDSWFVNVKKHYADGRTPTEDIISLRDAGIIPNKYNRHKTFKKWADAVEYVGWLKHSQLIPINNHFTVEI